MPTSDQMENEVDDIYEQIEKLIDAQKVKNNVVVMGHWNAVLGEERNGTEIGKFGLGTRHERGRKLVEFCRQRKMFVTNTWFQQERRRRYTWKMPGDTGRYQIDYILVRQCYRNSVMRERAKKQQQWDMENLKVQQDA